MSTDKIKMYKISDSLRIIEEFNGSLCRICNVGRLVYTGEHTNVRGNILKWESKKSISFPISVKESFPEGAWTYLFQCDYCDFAQFFPIFIGTAEFYNTITGENYYEHHREEYIQASRIIDNGKFKSLLEIGSGSGRFLEYVKSRNPEIDLHAIELNPNVLNYLSTVAKTYHSMESVKEKVDVVCAFQLIEHIASPIDMVKSCYEKIRSNGYLMLSTPNYDGPIRFFYDSLTEMPPHHLTRWNPLSLRTLMRNNGFDKVEIVKLPLRSESFEMYIKPLWWQLLKRIGLEKSPMFVNFGKILLYWARRFKFRSVPLIYHNILSIGRKP